MRVKDKIALVTGAAQGIGKACADLLVKEGATVFYSDCNDELGQKSASQTKSTFLHLDVRHEKDFEKVMQAILEKHGGLDILINNAGVTGFDEGMGPQDPEHASLESWHEVHRVNLDGVFLGIKHALPLMKGRGASIVNISSRSGMVGVPGAAAYASSKAAVRNHTKSVALYCADKKYKIRCNSIHPAAIHTPMWEPMLGTGKKRQEMIEQIASTCPLNTFGQSEDVAYAALYLACDESKYMTGSEITLDGGILAGSASAPAKSE